MLGQTISHYKITEKLGGGGMGVVYKAEDTRLGRNVALKFLPEQLQQDSTARKRFLREAKSAAALDHPFICHIHEVGEVEGKSFISMEYVQGQTLSQKLTEGPLPLKNALQMAVEIAEALNAAHKKDIVHRDLKPSNIMLTPEGHVKVMDFGLAKRVIPAEGQGEDITTALTRQGSTLGTVTYMSPEQVRGQEVDTRSDIFSFGVVLYEMLTGVNPFAKGAVMDTATAILSETVPPLTRYTEDIPVLLQHTVKKMLAKEPERRYQLIHDVRTDLGELLEESGESIRELATGLSGVSPTQVWWRQTGPLVVAALMVGAMLSGITVWNLQPFPETETGSIARFVLPLTLDGNRLSNELAITPEGSHLAVAPDGRHLAFIGRIDGVNKLYLRSMASLETKALADIGDDYPPPFFSPDGQWIGFFADGKLKKVPVTGGLPVVLCDAPSGRGGSWGESGTIVFSPRGRGMGLLRVSAEGGTQNPSPHWMPAKGRLATVCLTSFLVKRWSFSPPTAPLIKMSRSLRSG